MSEYPPSCTARKRGKVAARYEVNGTLMTVKEAADMCGVSVVSFRKRMERHGETVAGAAAHYMSRKPAGKTGLTDDEKAMVDAMADSLIAMEPTGGIQADLPENELMAETGRECEAEEMKATETAENGGKETFDRETLVVFNNLIGALEELLKLEMFDMEIDRKANELLYDMDRARWEMFGRMVDWKKIAEK